ncbi:MAG: ATP-dependent zinc metalloprotease FtsH [Candidatus Omnitrophota bacterium]
MNNHKQKKNNHTINKIKPGFDKSFFFWLLVIMAIVYLFRESSNIATPVKNINYGNFFQILKDNDKTQEIKSIIKIESELKGEFSDGSLFKVDIPQALEDKDLIPTLRENIKDFKIQQRSLFWSFIGSLFPFILLILFWWMMASRGQELGNRILGFGKSRAQLLDTKEKKKKITFQDVAGVDEAKEELQEVIEFLKDPKKFQRLGGKIPKGVLLVGPPGCGKTLIAKAVAGEAEVPFFSISGSDFVEMFVGVGASRVRDLFDQAKRTAKIAGNKGCIIFIDEIDAVGRLRFSGLGGGHDEREQTLNALLVEMDGFNPNEGIILVAATNRPDTLDPALLRPGRFDRHIVVDRPDVKGREAILKVHTKNIKVDPNVDLNSIARQTPGFSGADLANLCNEAALLAARHDKETVTMKEMQDAIERVIAGPERKSRVISKKEKEIVAYHESGHTLVSLLVPGVDPLHKVSIIPRGIAALGYTMQLPEHDRYIITRNELIGRITVLLGGRASEEITIGDKTTGAENDLEVATQLARKMVCEFGMSDKLGHLTLGRRNGPVFLGKDLVEERNYSEETAEKIDTEIHKIIDDAYNNAKKLLTENKDKLIKLANTLLEKEVMDEKEVRLVTGLTKLEEQTNKDISNV